MRIIGSIATALMILGLAAFSVVSGQKLNGGSPSATAFNPTAWCKHRDYHANARPPWRPSVSSGSALNASAQPKPAPAASSHSAVR